MHVAVSHLLLQLQSAQRNYWLKIKTKKTGLLENTIPHTPKGGEPIGFPPVLVLEALFFKM